MMNEKVNILEKGACWPVQMLLQKVLCSSQKCNFLLSLNQDAVDATLDPIPEMLVGENKAVCGVPCVSHGRGGGGQFSMEINTQPFFTNYLHRWRLEILIRHRR